MVKRKRTKGQTTIYKSRLFVKPEFYIIIEFFCLWVRVRVMVLNATFNNILVILRLSVLLMEETGVPGKNHESLSIDPSG
jgi:hypothetical protein